MAESQKRRKSKKAYVQQSKKPYSAKELSVGQQGILVTCNNQEKHCIAEAYNLLNEYATELYGAEEFPAAAAGVGVSSDEEEEEDVEKAVQKEVAALKPTATTERRFKMIRSGAKNVLFVKCRSEVDPYQLVHRILSDALATKKKKSRFCQRILPVTDTAYASIDSITTQAKRVLAPLFHKPACTDQITFAIVYKARNQGSIKRDDVIKAVADVAVNGGVAHKVDLTNPKLVICIEIIKNICSMVVLEDFYKLKRYNIFSIIAEGSAETQQESTATKDTTKTDQKAAAADGSVATEQEPTAKSN